MQSSTQKDSDEVLQDTDVGTHFGVEHRDLRVRVAQRVSLLSEHVEEVASSVGLGLHIISLNQLGRSTCLLISLSLIMLLDLPLLCSMGLSSLLFLTDSHLVSDLLGFVRVGDVGMLLANRPHHDLVLLEGSRAVGLICRKLSLVKRCHLHLLMLVRIISFPSLVLMMKSRLLLLRYRRVLT
jgi:hypothetical protein